ncbi:MAG: NAD(P)-dependent oxidoreductase [Pseudomonadota bacterium]
MKTFPMFLKVAGRRIVIIGGGEQAAQKARLALKTEAELVLIASSLDPELTDLVDSGRAQHTTVAHGGLFDDAALVFVATGCKGADMAWHAIAKAAGAVVNVVDYPDLCDAFTPSIVDRDPVVVAIGTEGNAPILGRQIKSRVELILHPRLGAFAALAGRLRAEVARFVPARDRRAFWHWVFGGAPWKTFSIGNERDGAAMVKASIAGNEPRTHLGRLSVVGGAISADLITLQIAERLQAADVIYAGKDVPGAVLELARRDARRVIFNFNDMSPAASAYRLAANTAGQSEDVVYLSTQSVFDLASTPNGAILERLNCATPDHGPLARLSKAVSTHQFDRP